MMSVYDWPKSQLPLAAAVEVDNVTPVSLCQIT